MGGGGRGGLPTKRGAETSLQIVHLSKYTGYLENKFSILVFDKLAQVNCWYTEPILNAQIEEYLLRTSVCLDVGANPNTGKSLNS